MDPPEIKSLVEIDKTNRIRKARFMVNLVGLSVPT
jgi:hypothetical protein